MVKIRLWKMGTKHTPIYRIVAMDSRVRRDGKYIEQIGHFDELKNVVSLDKELAVKWLNQGAQPSEKVKDLMSRDKIIQEHFEAKTPKHPKRKTSAKRKANAKLKSAAKATKVKNAKRVEALKAKKAASAPKVEEQVEVVATPIQTEVTPEVTAEVTPTETPVTEEACPIEEPTSTEPASN